MLTVGTVFSGIGAPEQALKNIHVKHKVLWACDSDKFAEKTYLANHKVESWYKNVTHIDMVALPPVDLFVFGFPCVDISSAGNQDLSTGRSNLLYHGLQIITAKKPKYFIIENVKNLLSAKFIHLLRDIYSCCGDLYDIKHKVLNAKNFGLPHHRERVFIVGVRSDITNNFEIPNDREIVFASDLQDCFDCDEKLCNKHICHFSDCSCLGPDSTNTLINILQNNVDSKYFLSDVCLKRIENIEHRAAERNLGYKNTILTKDDIMINLDASYHKGPDGKRGMIYDLDNNRPRMFTPRECARLMGFNDRFILPCSDTQTYKQLGNSICVNVLEDVMYNLLSETFLSDSK